MMLDAAESQLVLVDYQTRLMPAIWNGAAVTQRAVILAQVAQMMDVPVWGTEQNPDKLGPNDAALKALCQRTLSKMHFGACQPSLLDVLRPGPVASPSAQGNARSLPKHLQKPKAVEAPERNTVVVAGCETHVCLLQTALGLLEEEFDVWVVTDACSSRLERDRDAAFDRLAGNGAELVTTEMVAFEWLHTCEHPRFREVLSLIK